MKFKTVGNIQIEKSHFCKLCDENLSIDNADIIYGDQTAYVKCKDGFKIEGIPLLHCLRTSRWDLSKVPSCNIVKCETIQSPANARMKLNKISYKGTAEFTCNDGFELIGSAVISCTASGKWSENVPFCKSIFECPKINEPENGILIYASDSGLIDEKLQSYPMGAFVEIKCDDGFSSESIDLITCSDNGLWDAKIEPCIAEIVPAEFLRDFKEFLFKSCADNSAKLCQFYKTKHFNTNLMHFELPETSEFEGMDMKLFERLQQMNSNDDLNAENFIEKALESLINDKKILDAYRFVICLYVDLILLDEQLNIEAQHYLGANINENIKILLRKKIQKIYKKFTNDF
jgi:hypothetical protein